MSTLRTYLQREWLWVLVIALLGAVVHTPALQGERIWDDNYLARDNPFIKSPVLILEVFRHYLFLDSFSAHYRPVQNISFMLDYFLWNTDTWGFHLTNMLLHAGSGVLLYFLLRHLFASLLLRHVSPAVGVRALRRFPWISAAAFLVALIWVVHPVHSAAVDYISGRADSLAFLFAGGGWLLYVRARIAVRPTARVSLYIVAALSGLLALCSREIAFIWIGLFVAHLLFVQKRIPTRVRVCTILGCAAIIAIYVGLRQLPEQRPIATPDSWNAPVRATLMARALGDYARLMIFPRNLHMERTVLDLRLYQSSAGWRDAIRVEYLSILGLATLAALVTASIKKGRGQALRLFGAAWFLASYLPISNIVSLNATVAEHWLYLPSVGFLIFLTGCVVELPERCRRWIPSLALIAVAALSVQTFSRSSDWADEETFYTRTLAAGSLSARVACNLGQLYAKRNEFPKAERIFRLVLKENPDYPIAQNNLADLYYRKGKFPEAEKLFTEIEAKAKQTRTEYARTWIGALNHAIIRHNTGDDVAALAILDKARGDYPQVWGLIALEAEVLRKMNRIDSAVQLVEDFGRDQWWDYPSAIALGRLYAQGGDTECAEAALRRASRLDIHDAEALRLIAMMRFHENRFDEAIRIQQQAIARQPDEPRQYILLSDILEKMGRGAEAQVVLAKASRLRELVKEPINPNLTPVL